MSMKRLTAKELLAASFRELAEKMPVDKITVRDITENCGYSSATFYRQFRDKYDLIAWDYAQGTAAIMGKIDGRDYVWRQTLPAGAQRYADEKEYLANLFLHTSGQDAFIQYMADNNYEALMDYIERVNGAPVEDEHIKMLVRAYCLGTVSLTCEWILGRYEATPEELAAVYEDALPAQLSVYLDKE